MIDKDMKDVADTLLAKQYPKYQYSIFPNGNRGEQLVIRTETFEELIEAKKDINTILEKRKQTAPDAPKTVEQDDLGGTTCEIHNVPMKAREGQYGTFWSHAKEINGQWQYCNGKGYK